MSARAQSVAVPSFFLYGEPPEGERRHFVHLETLVFRSRANGWNIRPHAHANLSHLFFVQNGGGEMLAEQGRLSCESTAMLVIPARAIHAFHWRPKSTGWVLTISDTYLEDMYGREPGFRSLFKKPDCFEFDKDGPVSALFKFELAQLARELESTAPAHALAVEIRLLAILVEAMRLVQRARHVNLAPPGPHAQIAARFRAEVEENYRSNISLEAYAKKLAVSASRLRAACLKIEGQPPARLIQERRLAEARRLLLYSNMTIGEASYHLGYDDPAYFSRLFLRYVGQSPRNFRKQHFAANEFA